MHFELKACTPGPKFSISAIRELIYTAINSYHEKITWPCLKNKKINTKWQNTESYYKRKAFLL